jgi:hypothetical protein
MWEIDPPSVWGVLLRPNNSFIDSFCDPKDAEEFTGALTSGLRVKRDHHVAAR